MTKNKGFKPGRSGSPKTRFQPGNPHRWEPGVSGNPVGKSRHRAQFEESFNEALITEVGPEEAAKLLWEAARAKEPWAIQSLCQRFAPQTQNLHLVHERSEDGIDYSKLTDQQIEQLEAILDQTAPESPPADCGEGSAPSA